LFTIKDSRPWISLSWLILKWSTIVGLLVGFVPSALSLLSGNTISVNGIAIVGWTGVWIAGYIAEKAMKRDQGLLTNIIVGIAGSFVGGTLADLLNFNFYGFLGNLIVATAGAILILWIFGKSRAAS
jgi:uncharacterized membrane protein YeaQ/YmgE (transglycosylase-associated protein family)